MMYGPDVLAVYEKLVPPRKWYDNFRQQGLWEAFKEQMVMYLRVFEVGSRIGLFGSRRKMEFECGRSIDYAELFS